MKAQEEFVPAYESLLFDGALRPATRALFLKLALRVRTVGHLEVPGPEPLEVVLQRAFGDSAKEWRLAIAELTRGPKPKLEVVTDDDGERVLAIRTWSQWSLDARREAPATPAAAETETPDERKRRKQRERQAKYEAARRKRQADGSDGASDAALTHGASGPDVSADAPSHTLPLSEEKDGEGDRQRAREERQDLTSGERQEERQAKRQEPKKPRRKPETALPADWAPHAKHREFAERNSLNIDDEVIRMRDRAASKDERFVDWDARFFTWMRNAVDFRRNRGGAAKPTQSNHGADPLWAPRTIPIPNANEDHTDG